MTALLERPIAAPTVAVRRPAPPPLERPRAVLPLLPALALAVAAGVALATAFPAPGVWPLAFAAVAGHLLALRGRGVRGGFLVGLVFGVAFWFVLVDWVTLFLGPVPLLALGALEALLNGAGGALLAVVLRRAPHAFPGRGGRLVAVPLLAAAAWTAREAVASTWPYGGFGWGRLVESQATSPYAPLASWLGFGGTSFALAWLAAFALACALEAGASRTGRALAVALAATGLAAVPLFPTAQTGVLRVGAVQPDSHAGYFDPDNTAAGNLAAAVEASAPLEDAGVRLVVLPEAASEADPFSDAAAAAALRGIAARTGAHLLTGAITYRGPNAYNSSLLLAPDGSVQGVYDKVHPVPFGEYVPDRAFWTPFAPGLLQMIGRDFTPGTRSPVLGTGDVRIGVDICFDVVDDGLMLGAVADGAQVLVAQTNNADFGTTEENEQQLAIARLRAVETGRAIVTDSTVASTAVIGPDGRTLAAAVPFRAEALVADVPLTSGTTPAVAIGIALNAAIALAGVLLPLALTAGARRRA